MRYRNKEQNTEPGSFASLPDPCKLCEANGGNWAHSVRSHEMAGVSRGYHMAGRCSCARGRRLAQADQERAEGRTPAGMQIDGAAEEQRQREKWGQWKREHAEERRRLLEFGLDPATKGMPQ